jgi:nucleoside-diphosphate-sugar epimerase
MPLTLVTGVPGWLGTRLVRVLSEGMPGLPSLSRPENVRQIRCLSMPGQDAGAFSVLDGVEVVEGDLRDPDSLKAFCKRAAGATLFHCAGVVHPARSTREFFDVNVDGTRRLLHEAEAACIRRVVAVSSNSPIGTNPRRNHLFDEESPYNQYMNYGRSKMLMEQVVNEYRARGGLETVIVRPTWFYGPDQPERQTTFFRMIRRGSAPIVGDGENLRSMVYIDNLCQALLLCENAPVANGQTYWVADSRPYSVNEIVATVERLMDDEFGLVVAHKRLRLPSVAGEVAWLADALLQGIGFYQQKIHVLSEMNKTIACSIEKAQRELGYMPTIGLEEGMRRSLAWCLAEGIAL